MCYISLLQLLMEAIYFECIIVTLVHVFRAALFHQMEIF